jgi:4'-phosphopantetheinyl transferase
MPDLDSWAQSPSEYRIAQDEIHVWRANLDCDARLLRQLESTLAPDERNRAKRFHFERDRDNFVATRGLLRELLAKYIGQTPAEIEFDYSALGKPSLRTHGFERPIRFNVAHSHGMALFAFAVDRHVGVDIELLRPDFGGDQVAARYFAPQEIAELRKLPASQRVEAFFLCWTRKEAYVKARGEGLQIPLDSFHVSLTPGEPVQLHSADSLLWNLRSVRPGQRHVGAIVGQGTGWNLKLWDWKPPEFD